MMRAIPMSMFDLYGRQFSGERAKRKGEAEVLKVESNVFDEELIIEGCTVQVLRNSVTGEVSVGWWTYFAFGKIGSLLRKHPWRHGVCGVVGEQS